MVRAVGTYRPVRPRRSRSVNVRGRVPVEREGVGAGVDLVRLAGPRTERRLEGSGEPGAVVRVRAADPPLVAGTRVRLRLPAGTAAVMSDEIMALARLEVPPSLRNPGGLDALASA